MTYKLLACIRPIVLLQVANNEFDTIIIDLTNTKSVQMY